MLYILWNAVGIIIGGWLSEVIAHRIRKEQLMALLLIVNISMLVVGIQGAMETSNTILLMLSGAIGALIGTGLDLDEKFQKIALRLKSLMKKADEQFVQGFVTVFMIQCVGSMAILGPMNLRLHGDTQIIVFKIILDFISSLIYGMKFGKSVMATAPFVFAYEAIIYALSGGIEAFLTPTMTTELSAVGSLLILGMSLDLLGIIKMKVVNFLPAILVPLVYDVIQTVWNMIN